MAGKSEKPLFGASGLDIGAGEKLIKLGVVRVVFSVALIGDGAEDVTVKPEELITGADVAVVVEL